MSPRQKASVDLVHRDGGVGHTVLTWTFVLLEAQLRSAVVRPLCCSYRIEQYCACTVLPRLERLCVTKVALRCPTFCLSQPFAEHVRFGLVEVRLNGRRPLFVPAIVMKLIIEAARA